MGYRQLALCIALTLSVLAFQNCSAPDGYNAESLNPSPTPPPVQDVSYDYEPNFTISDIDPGLATVSAAGNLITNLDAQINGRDNLDDSAAFQRALNAAPANSIVYVPMGSFNFANTVNVRPGLTLAAQGTVTLNMTQADSRPVFRITNGSDMTISGFNFRRGGITLTNSSIGSNVIIQANSFTNIPGLALAVSNLTSSRIYENRFVNVGRSIAFGKSNGEPTNTFLISKNILTNVGSMGISVTGVGSGVHTITENQVSFTANHAPPNEFAILVDLSVRGDANVSRNTVSTTQGAAAPCTETGIQVRARVGSLSTNNIRGHWCTPLRIGESTGHYSVVRDTFVCGYRGTADAILRTGTRNAKTSIADTILRAACP